MNPENRAQIVRVQGRELGERVVVKNKKTGNLHKGRVGEEGAVVKVPGVRRFAVSLYEVADMEEEVIKEADVAEAGAT